MKAINATMEVLNTVTRYTENPVIPVQQVAILLIVLERGELPMNDLAKLVGIAQSSVSRNVAVLGRGLTPLSPGYSLLEAEEDPFYRRRKLVRLTPRGEAMKKELQSISDKYWPRPKGVDA